MLKKEQIIDMRTRAAAAFAKYPAKIRNNPFDAFCYAKDSDEQSQAGTALRLETVVNTLNTVLRHQDIIPQCGVDLTPK